MSALRALCVFCGSSPGASPRYGEAAGRLGTALARRGIDLVYGGSSVGLMARLADAALAAGGRVVGVIPQALVAREVAHHGLSELEVVESMHDRKARMAELADAFVALPGGLGTLEELFEVLTWGQLGFHRKPCALLEVDDYFAPLQTFLDHAVQEGFVRAGHRRLLLSAREPQELLDRLAAFEPPEVESKWLHRGEL